MPKFMNEYEIEELTGRFGQGETPNLLTGANVLRRLCRWTNSNSDGWAYWPKPTRAAAKLMELLDSVDRFDPQDCTDGQLRSALTPIKAFLTKQGVDHEVVFPTGAVQTYRVEIRFDDAGLAGPVEPGRRMVTLIRVDDQRRTAVVDLEFRAVKPLPVAAADSIDRDVAPIACRDDDPA